MIKFDAAKVMGFYELHNRHFMAFRIPNVWHSRSFRPFFETFNAKN